jgi:hypothetical protein
MYNSLVLKEINIMMFGLLYDAVGFGLPLLLVVVLAGGLVGILETESL